MVELRVESLPRRGARPMCLVAPPDIRCRLSCRPGLVGKCDVAWAVGRAKAAGAVGNAGESDRGDGGWRKFYRFNPR